MRDIEEAMRQQEMSETSIEQVKNTFSGVPKEMAVRMLTNKDTTGKVVRDQFPPELRALALTLHFYSAKAYEFVRNTFECSLPHPATIRKWYSHLEGECGFTGEVMSALGQLVKGADGKRVLCSLMVDEMAIRKHVQWDGEKFRGYVDTGDGSSGGKSCELASEALVYMAVALDGSWKVPCGYFFINRL